MWSLFLLVANPDNILSLKMKIDLLLEQGYFFVVIVS